MSILKGLKMQRKFRNIMNNISSFEDIIIKNYKKNYINLDKKCVFVTGMPRSGTTIITQTLSKHGDFASYDYSDLPFTKIPYLWSKFKKIYYFKNKAFERVHGDKLKIDLDSPDAFEELIWSENINDYKESLYRYLDSNFNNSSLEDDLLRNINKLLLIKKKNIYLSKANYSLFRIKFIQSIIKNSHFIICIRNPDDVINSSIRTHKKFEEMDKKNNTFSEEMSELCHFEFGVNRIGIIERSNCLNDYDYYLKHWIKIHKLILKEYKDMQNVYLINYEKFISDPKKTFSIIEKKLKIESSISVNKFIEKTIKIKNFSNNNNFPSDETKEIYENLIKFCIN